MTRALPDKLDPVIGQGSATTQKAKRFRIAIAGCGPCGLASALLLHAQGHAVTLFERFDEPRPLGSGLIIQPTGLAVLQALGLAERIQAAGSRIHRLHGIAGRRTVLDVRYAALKRPGLFGIGLHRASLFDALYGAVIAAGIPLQKYNHRSIRRARRPAMPSPRPARPVQDACGRSPCDACVP